MSYIRSGRGLGPCGGGMARGFGRGMGYYSEDIEMVAKKGVPKRDGSGKGTRANRGRGGCKTTRNIGRGRNKK